MLRIIILLTILISPIISLGQQQLPKLTSPLKQVDYWASHAMLAGSIAADLRATARWGGQGTHPCAVERYTYKIVNGKIVDGTLHNDQIFAGAGLLASTMLFDWGLRIAFPHSKAARIFTNALPITLGAVRIPAIRKWYYYCG